MKTFNINQYGITVKDSDTNETTMVRTGADNYAEAKTAVMHADWDYFDRLVADDVAANDEPDIGIVGIETSGIGMAGLIGIITGLTMNELVEDDSPEFEEDDDFLTDGNSFILTVQSLIADGIISPEDLITEDNLEQFAAAMPTSSASHEHDLSNWNGSPIFYPTREMARAQSDRWGMFWEYHDFGIASPTGYRYATVPRGVGPTAPEGYDWVCLPREE